MESYRVVVPSPKRVKNMPRLLSLLPTALVAVAEEEEAEYAQAVPRKQLVTHKATGLIAIRNWILDTIQEPCVVQIDDDFRGVILLTKGWGRPRIKEPDTIQQIIENSLRVTTDLGIGVFCWARTQNTVLIDVRQFPFRVVAPMAAAFGIRGPARDRRFDPFVLTREDLDFSLQTLVEDRILYTDMRFYFDFGRSFSGTGGNAGQQSIAELEESTRRLARKWGRCVSSERPGCQKGLTSNITPMSIRVSRRNPAVVEGN